MKLASDPVHWSNASHYAYTDRRGNTVRVLGTQLKTRGEWSDIAVYKKNDVVALGSLFYVALADNQRSRPGESKWWSILAAML